MDYLTSRDYPDLCGQCKVTLDLIVEQLPGMVDEYASDNEGGIMFMYDHSLHCDGRECANVRKMEEERASREVWTEIDIQVETLDRNLNVVEKRFYDSPIKAMGMYSPEIAVNYLKFIAERSGTQLRKLPHSHQWYAELGNNVITFTVYPYVTETCYAVS